MVDNSRDVELVIKARDEATQTIKTINQSLKGVVETQKSLRTAGAGSDSVFKSLAGGLKSLKSLVGPDGVFGKLSQQTGAFKANITRLISSIADYKGQMRGLKEEQDSISRSINTAADNVAKLTTKQEIQTTLANESKLALKALGTELGVLGREQIALGNTTNKLNASLAASQNAIIAANDAIQKGDSDIDRRRGKLQKLINKENELNAALDKARGTQQTRINRGDTSSQAYLNGQARIERLSGQIGKNQSDQQKEIDGITRATAARNAHIKTIGKEEAAIVQNGVKQEENANAIDKNTAAIDDNNQKTARATQLDNARKSSLKSTEDALAVAEGELAGYNKTLGESEQELKKLERNIASSEEQLKGFRKELGAVEAEEKAAQKSLKALATEFKATLEPAMKDAKRVARGLDEEFDNLQKEFKELNAVLDTNGIHTNAQTRRLAELKAEMRAVDAARRSAYTGHRNLSNLRKEPVGDLPDLSDRVGRAQVAVSQTTQAEKELVSIRRQAIKVAKEREAAEEKLAAAKIKDALASKKAAAAERRHAEAMRRSAIAGKANIGVLRHLRTSVLALGSAYIGFHAITSGFGAIIDSTKKLEAAQNRLRVVVGDGQQVIGEEIDFVRRNAERLGIQFGMLAQEYTKFSIATKNTILEGQHSRDIFLSVSEAARVNNASTEDLKGTYLALIQIISKGRITMEELKRQLGDRLPGAVHIMAEALGVGTDELLKIVEAGDLSSDKLIEFADTLDRRFGPGLASALKSTQALIGKLENAIFQASLRLGRGGFIEAFNNLLSIIQKTLASPDFVSFLDRSSVALAAIMNLVAFGVKHWQNLLVIISSLIALKVVFWIRSIGYWVVFTNQGVFRGTAAWAALTTQFKLATAAGFRLGAMFKTLGLLLKATWFGILLVALPAVVGYFANLATKTTETNAILSRHKAIVDTIANAYDEAGKNVRKLAKEAAKLVSLPEARINAEATTKIAQDKIQGIRSRFAFKATQASHYTVSTGEGIGEHEDAKYYAKILPQLDKYIAAITAVDATRESIAQSNKDFQNSFTGIGIEFNKLGVDTERLDEIFTEIRPVIDEMTASVLDGGDAVAILQLLMNNPQIFDAWHKSVKDNTLSIAELSGKLKKAATDFENIGGTNDKGLDAATAKLGLLKDRAFELEQEFAALKLKLNETADSEEELAEATANFEKGMLAREKAVQAVREEIDLLIFTQTKLGTLGVAGDIISQNTGLDKAQSLAKAAEAREIARGKIKHFDSLPINKQAIVIQWQFEGNLTEDVIEQVNKGTNAGIEVAAQIVRNYGIGLEPKLQEQYNLSANRFEGNAEGYAAANEKITEDLLRQRGLTTELIANLKEELVLLGLTESGLKKEAFIRQGLTAALANDSTLLEGSKDYLEIQELLAKLFRDNENKRKKTALQIAEDERKKLDALIALREAEQQIFDIERDRAVREGRNTHTDPLLNSLRDKDKGRGLEIDVQLQKVIGLFKALKDQSPEVRQALAELAILFGNIEIAAGRATGAFIGWNDVGEIATGSLRGSMDVLIKKMFEGVKAARVLESALLNLISTFSAKIGDAFLDLAAKAAIDGVGKLFGLLIGGFGSAGSYAGGALKKFGFGISGGASSFHDGGFVRHGGSKGYDFDINSLHLPRKHKGGLIGLASDEVPAILQTGELVVPRDKVKEAMKGGGGGQLPPIYLNNYNTWDKKEAQDNLLNDDGADDIQVQRMSKSPRKYKNALGIK